LWYMVNGLWLMVYGKVNVIQKNHKLSTMNHIP
jgi:hypothetical protein